MVVHVGLAAVLVGRVLVRLVAVGEGRVVVLMLVAGVRWVQSWPPLR
jgi:hypothetical protein